MIKTAEDVGIARVHFTLDSGVAAQNAAVCGDWNNWSRDADKMDRDRDGSFSLVVRLETGRSYRFRYLLDDQRWENDWAADAYVPNAFGEDDSVVDLTAFPDEVSIPAEIAAKPKSLASKKKVASGKKAVARASGAQTDEPGLAKKATRKAGTTKKGTPKRAK